MTKVVGGSTASRDQFSSPGCQEEGDLAANRFANSKGSEDAPEANRPVSQVHNPARVSRAGTVSAAWQPVWGGQVV